MSSACASLFSALRDLSVGNPFPILFWWSVLVCYHSFHPGAAWNRLSVTMVYCLSPAMRLLSICCTSNPLLQSVVLPSSASCQYQSRHLTESFNARRSAIDTFLFRIMPCDNLLSFISDYKKPDRKYRILSCQNFWHHQSLPIFLKFLYVCRMKAVKTTRLVDHADSITAVLYWLPFQPSCLLWISENE